MKARPARAAIGIAAESAGVHARPQARGDLGGGQHGPAGQAAAQGLRQRHHVGRDAEALVGEPIAGPAAAGLHFVEDQQQLVLVGQLAQAGQEAVGRNADAAFALDRLDHDGRRLVVDQPGHGVQVAERGVDEAGHQRPEPLVVLRLRGGRGRAQRAAVEAALEGDDLVALLGRVQPGELDGRLVGLGARVAEERLAAETPLRQRLGPQALQFGVPGVGHVDQLAQLLADGLDHRRRTMAQQIAAPAAEQVEIAVPLGVPDVRSFARAPTRPESGRSWESRNARTVFSVSSELMGASMSRPLYSAVDHSQLESALARRLFMILPVSPSPS